MQSEPNAIDALQAIADLPTGRNEDVMEGQEQAYRSVEALFKVSPHIFASPSPISADAVVEACAKVADDLAREWEGDAELCHRDGMLKTAAISLHHSEAAKKVATAIRALKGTFPAAPGAKSEVKVKPLAWDEARISDQWPRFTAETILGTYEALQWSSGDFGYTCPNTDRNYPNEEHGDLESLEAAKAAAQHDFSARIRSALVDPEGGATDGETNG